MTVVAPPLPGVTTRSRSSSHKPVLCSPACAVASALAESPVQIHRASKKQRRVVDTTTPSPRPQAVAPPHHVGNLAFEQWLDDVANVDISLAISLGQPGQAPAPVAVEGEEHPDEDQASTVQAEFSVSIPVMLTRVLQSKLAIDPTRLTTLIQGDKAVDSAAEVFVALSVKGREGPIAEAIEGGLTPRKAFLRSAPHISRVASRLQDCMRQIFGMKDFVVKVD